MPAIREAIPGGRTQITGQFTVDSARELANVLKYGSLPLSFESSEAETVSATLGLASLRAGLIGLFSQNLILMGIFFTIPLYLQLVLGLDALETGIKMLPVSILMFIASAAGSRLSNRFSVRGIVRTGLALTGMLSKAMPSAAQTLKAQV